MKKILGLMLVSLFVFGLMGQVVLARTSACGTLQYNSQNHPADNINEQAEFYEKAEESGKARKIYTVQGTDKINITEREEYRPKLPKCRDEGLAKGITASKLSGDEEERGKTKKRYTVQGTDKINITEREEYRPKLPKCRDEGLANYEKKVTEKL